MILKFKSSQVFILICQSTIIKERGVKSSRAERFKIYYWRGFNTHYI